DHANGFVQRFRRRISQTRHETDHAFLPIDGERDTRRLMVVTQEELVDLRVVLIRFDDDVARELDGPVPRFDLDADPFPRDTGYADEPEVVADALTRRLFGERRYELLDGVQIGHGRRLPAAPTATGSFPVARTQSARW